MTIGPLIPGTPTTVTPDAGHAAYASVQGPAPDGPVVADDVLAAIQVSLNVQAHADSKLLSGNPAQMVNQTGVSAGWIFEVNSTANLGRYTAYGSDPGYGAPWVYASTGTPGIYWVHDQSSMVMSTATGGILAGICRVGPMSTIDPSTPNGRIPASVVQNRIVHQSAMSTSALLSVALDASTVLTPQKTLLGSTFTAVLGDQVVGSFGPLSVRNWGTSGYAEISIVLNQDVSGTPTLIVLNRFRIGPANASQPAVNPYMMVTPTMPFNATVTRAGTARIEIAAAASSSGVLDFEGMNATEFTLGSVTVYRP